MILLDTHVWFYWVNDSIEELSKNALDSIHSSNTLGVNVISCWEIAMLVVKERLKLSIDVLQWVNQALKYPGIQLIQLDPDIAVLSTRLPGVLHGDPADRIIAATCMKLNIPLLTKDKRLQAWDHIKTIW